MKNENLWQDLLSTIKSRINRQNFEIWFTQIHLLAIDDHQIDLEVPNRYFHDWIKDNYQDLIYSELERLAGHPYQLVFKYAKQPDSQTAAQEGAATTARDTPSQQTEAASTGNQFSLNPEKTFDTFVVGSSNQFADAAARAVADNPAQTYNPLFLFGTVGLGKTHLLNAIGNKILSERPNSRVIYLSSEQFVNELINSIRYERMNEFRNKYRDSCDALLVDDIQFLGGKIRTQEEFFYTFNALHSSGKQIVVTSDKFPKDILGMEERLRNRFEWGLIADIQPPDLETKVAILKKKAAKEDIALPDDVSLYIASHIKSNIRELEGILIRLIASSSFYGKTIDLTFTKQMLGQLLDNGRPPITIDTILEVVSKHFSLNVVDLKSHRKYKQLVRPRQIAMFLSRKYTNGSFPEIGQRFGGRDHTTAIHAVKRIEELLKKEPQLGDELKNIERSLGL